MAEEKICPKCGKPMKLRTSKSGNEFWGCTGYPECKYTESKDQNFVKCPKCGKDCKLFTYKDKKTGEEKQAFVCECGEKNWDYKE